MHRCVSSRGTPGSNDFSKQTGRKFQKRKWPPGPRNAGENRHGKLSSGREQTQAARDAPASGQSSDAGVGFIRQRVDPETLQYFAEIASLLGMGGTMTDPDDRATLCANALEETHGKEIGLACDRSCSRVLEMLVLSCDVVQVASFLHRISPDFAFIANDVSGSHVAEALLKSAAAALHNYDGDSAWYRTLELALAAICKVVGERAVDMMSNCYGSHVVRSLLSVVSGALLDRPSDKMSGKLSTGLVRRLYSPPNMGSVSEPKKIHFPHLLHSLVEMLLQGAEKDILRLCQDPYAGPVLQAILKTLKGNAAAVTKAICIILNCDSEILVKEGNVLGLVPPEDWKQLIFDSSSSHLVEVILEVATDAVYMEMFQQIFHRNLLDFSLHHVANFVIQALITSARCQEQVNIILVELGSSFSKLIKAARSGVIASILIACQRFHTCEQEACRLLAQAINSDLAAPTCLVPRLLFLEDYGRCEVTADWTPRFGKKMSIIGCVILQTIFSYSEECNQQFWLSLVAMDSDDILATVKDPGGCHVVESFLSWSVPLKHKNRVISKLKGHFAELASHMLSSFTVDKCFSVGNIRLKEVIASELATVQADLTKTKHGPHLIKKCDTMGYLRQPDHWRQRMTAKQGTFKEFSDIFEPGSTFEINNAKSGTAFPGIPDIIKAEKNANGEESGRNGPLKKKRKSKDFAEAIVGMDNMKGLRSISLMEDDVRITEQVSLVHKPKKRKQKHAT